MYVAGKRPCGHHLTGLKEGDRHESNEYYESKRAVITVYNESSEASGFFQGGIVADRRGFDYRDQCDNGRREESLYEHEGETGRYAAC